MVLLREHTLVFLVPADHVFPIVAFHDALGQKLVSEGFEDLLNLSGRLCPVVITTFCAKGEDFGGVFAGDVHVSTTSEPLEVFPLFSRAAKALRL